MLCLFILPFFFGSRPSGWDQPIQRERKRRLWLCTARGCCLLTDKTPLYSQVVAKETERHREATQTNQILSDPHCKRSGSARDDELHRCTNPSQLYPLSLSPTMQRCGRTVAKRTSWMEELDINIYTLNVCFRVAESARITCADSYMRCESSPATDGQRWVCESALNPQKCALTTAHFSFRLQ